MRSRQAGSFAAWSGSRLRQRVAPRVEITPTRFDNRIARMAKGSAAAGNSEIVRNSQKTACTTPVEPSVGFPKPAIFAMVPARAAPKACEMRLTVEMKAAAISRSFGSANSISKLPRYAHATPIPAPTGASAIARDMSESVVSAHPVRMRPRVTSIGPDTMKRCAQVLTDALARAAAAQDTGSTELRYPPVIGACMSTRVTT